VGRLAQREAVATTLSTPSPRIDSISHAARTGARIADLKAKIKEQTLLLDAFVNAVEAVNDKLSVKARLPEFAPTCFGHIVTSIGQA
jgi:hypothetical protein